MMKPENENPMPILLYHSIARAAGHKFLPFIVRPDDFAAQMSLLREFGCTPLTISQLAAAIQNPAAELPEYPVAITFDDGFADFYDEALPILQRFGFSATLYVATAYVASQSRWLGALGEGDRPMMTWEMLREARQAGVEIGAHSHTHTELDILDEASAFEEIQQPKTLLEDRLGAEVASFAYPYGYHSERTMALVQGAGYQSACAVNQALSFRGDNVFALSRITVYVDTHLADLRKWLRGDGLPAAPKSQRLQSRLWRAYRSIRTHG
jgi:peptidoglycan/xylan/chitin deacetylase (PgdA/CDA1 family)